MLDDRFDPTDDPQLADIGLAAGLTAAVVSEGRGPKKMPGGVGRGYSNWRGTAIGNAAVC